MPVPSFYIISFVSLHLRIGVRNEKFLHFFLGEFFALGFEFRWGYLVCKKRRLFSLNPPVESAESDSSREPKDQEKQENGSHDGSKDDFVLLVLEVVVQRLIKVSRSDEGTQRLEVMLLLLICFMKISITAGFLRFCLLSVVQVPSYRR